MLSQKEHQAKFRFYEELNDFLPLNKRKISFPYHFNGMPSIKDAIEACGVPHTEVDLIVVNGESVGFDYHLQHDDYVSVYPVFEGLDISPIVKLREKPLRSTEFICDVHLGRLARLIRMFGFDTLYRNNYDDATIIAIAVTQKRIILTRDRQLLHAKVVTHGYWVRSLNPYEQLKEIVGRFDLIKQIKPFNRCIACNGTIVKVLKDSVFDMLEPKTRLYFTEFFRCESCGKIYWDGSHCREMRLLIRRFMQ